jgi:SAM-dependent methyltransferase
MRTSVPVEDGARDHRETRVRHWDRAARRRNRGPSWARGYHERLTAIYRFLVPPCRRVLELGCGPGDLLAAVEPAVGVGVDFSSEMIAWARERHPYLRFVEADVHDLAMTEPFDVIILSDLVNELWDVQRVFERLVPLCTARTRLIVNTYSRLWELPLALVRRLGLATPVLGQNWLTTDDVVNMLDLAGFERLRSSREILWPLRTPLVASLLNRGLVRLWPLDHLALTNFVLARPKPRPGWVPARPTVSVVVPARNEAGNVPAIFARTPEMGAGTELVFVEGHSRDGTVEAIERAIAAHPERQARLFRQAGTGKGDAVRLGFQHATGDVLMILDADLTVPPELLPRFLDALDRRTADFANGVRFVYPMEGRAMRLLNLVGNKLFGLAFTWMIGQPIKDTLCGTKVLWAEDYRLIAAHRSYFGEFDPFGDFDLLFGAAKLGLKIVDVPVRYRARTYGETNIQRFRHGGLLLKMLAYAALRLKFV